MKHPWHLLPLYVLILCLSSCSAPYFQDSDSYLLQENDDSLSVNRDLVVRPYDILYINVKTYGTEINDYLAITDASPLESGAYYRGYLVSRSGTVELPLVGMIHISGKTLKEVREELEDRFSKYVNNPFIEVKFLTFKVYVLGEVQSPGLVTLATEAGTLMDALSLSGDLTDYGNREKIKVIRQGERPTVQYVDLTKTDFIGGAAFHLQPNDIVYIEPIAVKNLQKITPFVSLGLSLFTAIVTLLTYLARRQ
ncbi:MAG: polysaccharide biosynthesis/export family protein [Bacteroidia bacterium]